MTSDSVANMPSQPTLVKRSTAVFRSCTFSRFSSESCPESTRANRADSVLAHSGPLSTNFVSVFLWSRSLTSLVIACTIVDSRFGRLLFTRSSAQSGAASGNLAATGFASAELWHLDATTGEERMLFSTKHGSLAGFAWSPDGRTLAFDNHRGDHGFVGLYDYFAGGAVQWVAPSYDTDYGVLW